MTKAGYVLTALLVVLLSTPVFATTPWATRDDGRAGASQAAPSRVAPLLELWQSVFAVLGIEDPQDSSLPVTSSLGPDEITTSDPTANGDHGAGLDPNG